MKEKKIFIGTPMYGGSCFYEYVMGLLDTQKKLMNEGYKIEFSVVVNDSLVQRARNTLVDKFLQSNAEYLIFIDSDIGFTGNDVLELIKSNKDIVCGLYPKKVIDWDRINILSKLNYTDLQKYSSSFVVNILHDLIEENPFIDNFLPEIQHGGTGFMLISKKVFETLSPHVKEYKIDTIDKSSCFVKEFFTTGINQEDGLFLSEDYNFCNLWRIYGGKIYANLKINLSHCGFYKFQGDLIEGGANVKGLINNVATRL